MEFVRYDAEQSQPLEGGKNVNYVPIRSGERLVAMILHFERKGDTGKREVPTDVLVSVVRGEGRLRSGGTIADLRTGDVAVLPGGIMHHLWTSDSEMMLVMMERGA